MMTGNCMADIVVMLKTLPTSELSFMFHLCYRGRGYFAKLTFCPDKLINLPRYSSINHVDRPLLLSSQFSKL